jgi:hypothetical protein
MEKPDEYRLITAYNILDSEHNIIGSLKYYYFTGIYICSYTIDNCFSCFIFETKDLFYKCINLVKQKLNVKKTSNKEKYNLIDDSVMCPCCFPELWVRHYYWSKLNKWNECLEQGINYKCEYLSKGTSLNRDTGERKETEELYISDILNSEILVKHEDKMINELTEMINKREEQSIEFKSYLEFIKENIDNVSVSINSYSCPDYDSSCDNCNEIFSNLDLYFCKECLDDYIKDDNEKIINYYNLCKKCYTDENIKKHNENHNFVLGKNDPEILRALYNFKK